ncbi:MAG: phage N-6-adenine-methyltransferase [Colwellia sp.]|nr:phage N-6-adenine-methyltransferase [Colwellia sp.]
MDSNTPMEHRDYWSTPQYIYDWLDSIYHFDIDLAASKDNAKHEVYYSEKYNALSRDWCSHGRNTGFLNPPYSDISPWVNQAIIMQSRGFTSVMVIPTPNGESYYEAIFDEAEEIIFINGRLSFIASCTFIIPGKKGKPDRQINKGDAVSGNNRGSCVVVFGQGRGNNIKCKNFRRDVIKGFYGSK